MSTSLKEIENMAVKFNNSVEDVSRELKRIQSIKCRLKKQKGKSTYEKEMTETLKYEQVLNLLSNILLFPQNYISNFHVLSLDILIQGFS